MEFTQDELREIVRLCTYAQQTGLSRDDDEIWMNEEAYKAHLQRKSRVEGIKQKAERMSEHGR